MLVVFLMWNLLILYELWAGERLVLEKAPGYRRSAKNDAKCVNPTPSHGELVKIMSRFKVRTALRETATRSINCAHFSIL